MLPDTSDHTPRQPQSVRLVLDLPTQQGCKAELTCLTSLCPGRESNSRPPRCAGGHVCRVGESVTHVRIRNDGNCFNLLGSGDETFATLGELVRHYVDDNAKPLHDTAGTVIELKYPLPSVDHNNQR